MPSNPVLIVDFPLGTGQISGRITNDQDQAVAIRLGRLSCIWGQENKRQICATKKVMMNPKTRGSKLETIVQRLLPVSL